MNDPDDEGGDIDDLDTIHPIECDCISCIDGLYIEMYEERRVDAVA
jgi:hypothetical protein